MYVINKQTLSLKELHVLMEILKQSCLNNKKIISYQEFLMLTKLTVEEIMKTSFQKIGKTNSSYSCQIKQLKNPIIRGEFIWQDNQVIINEDVIKNLYFGNILELSTILHELNHFLIKYDILTGKISYDLVRIIKELFLRSLGLEELDNKKKTIKTNSFDNSFVTYYQDNYQLDSEEKVVNIHTIYDFIILLDHFNIQLCEFEKKQLKVELLQNKIAYQNYIRDVRNNTNFNSFFIDFEKAFDIMLKNHHLEWLEICPQLNIEYYLDDLGHIQKRTKEQLLQLLKLDLNKESKEFIDVLIKENYQKRLDKTVFTENNLNTLSKTYPIKKKVKQKNIYKEIKLFS